MNQKTGYFPATGWTPAGRASRGALGLATALLFAASLLAGCDQPPPEAQLSAAGEALGEATTELADLDSRIERTETMLDELRSERRKQRARVRTLEERLEARATDMAIFRAVQTALLGDEQLQDVAIAVDVEDKVVSLNGVVRTENQARRAVELSKRVAGIARVASRIRVDDPQANADNGK